MFLRVVKTLAMTALALLTACGHSTQSTQGYIDGEYTYVAAPSAGYLHQLSAMRGSRVKLGDALFTLDAAPDEFNAAQALFTEQAAEANLINLIKGERPSEIQTLQAQIDQAKSQVELAHITWQRQQKLFEQNWVQKQTRDEAYTQFLASQDRVTQLEQTMVTAKLGAREDAIKQASAQVAAAKADYAKAKWYLQEKNQVAPKTGVIFDTFYVSGEWVNAGQPVLALLAPEDNYVIFFVPEIELSKLQLQHDITFDCDSCQQKLTAKIVYISPQAEYTPPVIYSNSNRANLVYRVRARLPADIALNFHPGQPVVVHYG